MQLRWRLLDLPALLACILRLVGTKCAAVSKYCLAALLSLSTPSMSIFAWRKSRYPAISETIPKFVYCKCQFSLELASFGKSSSECVVFCFGCVPGRGSEIYHRFRHVRLTPPAMPCMSCSQKDCYRKANPYNNCPNTWLSLYFGCSAIFLNNAVAFSSSTVNKMPCRVPNLQPHEVV